MAEQFIFFGSSAATLSALVGANQTYWDATTGEDYPTATRAPFTDGFGSASAWNGADRSSSGIAPYLAGLIYNDGTNMDFEINVPNGEYVVRMAMGDRAAARSAMSWVLRDGGGSGSVLHSVVSASTSGADNFVDINGTNHTAANYPTNKTSVTVTIAAGSLHVEVGSGGFWNYISLEPVAAGGGSTPSEPPRRRFPLSILNH